MPMDRQPQTKPNNYLRYTAQVDCTMNIAINLIVHRETNLIHYVRRKCFL